MPGKLITVYYDGHCGLCHGFVKFLMARDPRGDKFDFAPLQGAYCAATISTVERKNLPDSVVVRGDDGALLVKSSAVIFILRRLGGIWAGLGSCLAILPRPLRDFGYEYVARVRRLIFATPPDTCPIVPPEQRSRFHP